ncbi:MAG: histidine kinase [Saprospiraceae bacterium]|nr:histidine kinase [Saprospiraceae bacterium]
MNFGFTNNFDSIYISTEDSIKTLELSCSILDPSLSNQTGYKFKLANSDNWQVSEVNRIYLGELPEGHHQVKIIAYDKITSQELASKTIHCFVSTPWYKSKYFKFFILLLIIGLAIHVTRYFLTRRYKSLIALNEAVLENRSLKLKALEAQMNPHLIYNSLGGIQSLVQTQNYNKAEHYIIKFSKLLRMLLDSLRKNEVSLDKELELLSAYLEIEKFRFNDRFKYNLYTDPKLEKESIYIPNMLIQPFVENALNHGLFHRIEGGLLNINIQKSKSDLVVEIVDNGIGVKQAKEKYKTSRLGHESHALNIIQEKIELFKNLKNFHIVISTQDLDPTNKDYPGTHVTFTFKNILENE